MSGKLGRAFSLVELLVVIAIIALLIGILVPTLGKARDTARRAKDSAQIRSIGQGANIQAGNNEGSYPIPSQIDISNSTVKTDNPQEKDNTGNIMSLLVWEDAISTEDLVSPVETNDQVEVYAGYQKKEPTQAEKPEFAAWDPGLAGVTLENAGGLTGTGRGRASAKGNNSYANLPPFGARRGLWRSDADASTAVFSNRGSIFSLDTNDNWILRPAGFVTGDKSNTLEFYDPLKSWGGNIGYADGSVEFSARPDPDRTGLVSTTNDKKIRDNIFVNETDTGASGNRKLPDRGVNNYLRPWYNIEVSSAGNINATPWDIEDRPNGQGGGD
ncbi:MAG: prepilin-type N-terminal cleavage/methylation domain-containing protein [Phycisphaerales bacterium]|nr:prepilin-type N-terminal cleavage/methylation domain-containing protein [Phycisphaerales bacterium]MCB9836450.1 prepilin-type N-terminal cleavage/methylation domain-containing protein [Phycisphaera sp.]